MSDKEEEEEEANEIPVEVKSEESTVDSEAKEQTATNDENLQREAEESTVDSEEKEQTATTDENLQTKVESEKITVDELKEHLLQEKQKLSSCEDKLKHTLADFQNLERKKKSDIENGVNARMDEFMLNFLQIYDDFKRAKAVLADGKMNKDGLDSILKNMDLLLSQYHITPVDSLGEIFDPNLHEALSVVEDETLDENTITKEIRKGYISQERVIRPALVEISKKPRSVKSEDE